MTAPVDSGWAEGKIGDGGNGEDRDPDEPNGIRTRTIGDFALVVEDAGGEWRWFVEWNDDEIAGGVVVCPPLEPFDNSLPVAIKACEDAARAAGIAVPDSGACPPIPTAAWAVIVRIATAGGKARGVGPWETGGGQTAAVHADHAAAHINEAFLCGYGPDGEQRCIGVDKDSGELSVAHAAVRAILALVDLTREGR